MDASLGTLGVGVVSGKGRASETEINQFMSEYAERNFGSRGERKKKRAREEEDVWGMKGMEALESKKQGFQREINDSVQSGVNSFSSMINDATAMALKNFEKGLKSISEEVMGNVVKEGGNRESGDVEHEVEVEDVEEEDDNQGRHAESQSISSSGRKSGRVASAAKPKKKRGG